MKTYNQSGSRVCVARSSRNLSCLCRVICREICRVFVASHIYRHFTGVCVFNQKERKERYYDR